MKPLSLKRRRIFITIFFLAFFIFIPVVLLYASGYRLGEGFSLVKTGGIYIFAVANDVEVTIDDGEKMNLGLFQNGFYIQDLTPGKYTVKLTKDGYYPWVKTLKVNPQMVSEAIPIIIPKEIPLIEIEKYKAILATSTATSSINKTNKGDKREMTEQYKLLSNLFASTTEKNQNDRATGTKELIRTKNKVTIWQEGNSIYSKWNGKKEDVPSSFCNYISCNISKHKIIETRDVRDFNFFPGRNDVIIISTDNSIVVAEIDTKSIQNIVPIYTIPDSDFVIDENDILYIKDQDQIFEVNI